MNNKTKNKINTNDNSKTKLKLGILAVSVIAVLMISPSSVTQYAYATDAPIIISLAATDPDNLDNVYSVGDTITITFDSDTNTPGGTEVKTRQAVDRLFTFTDLLGRSYSGQWTASDTFTITIDNVNNAGPPVVGTTTVTPAGTTPILSFDGTSDTSSTVSPVLFGDFGTTPSNDWVIDEGIIHYDGGNVGIGTDDPQAKLDVNGSINANNHLTHLPWYSFYEAPQGPWVPGYVKLVTPIVENESNMFTIKITGYRYGIGGAALEIQCGGYAYDAGGLQSTGCITEGTSDPVGIGVENGVVIITIGDGASTWYYDHFTVEYVGWKQKNPDDFQWEFVSNVAPSIRNTNNIMINDQEGTIITSGDVGIGGNAIADNWLTPSSQKWKKDITPLDSALDKVIQIQGVTYQWRADEFPEMSFDDTATQIGFIAEELEMIYPELVHTTENGDKSIDYSKLTPILLEAIKEQQNSIEEQQDILEQLKTVICPEHPELSACQ